MQTHRRAVEDDVVLHDAACARCGPGCQGGSLSCLVRRHTSWLCMRSINALAALTRTSGRVMLDLVLPPQCPTCDVVVGDAGRFCPDCFKRAAFIVEPCCVRCGVGFSSVGEAGLSRVCAACLAAPPIWSRARAALCYDDFSKNLILPLKYADRTENARFLAVHMARAGAALLSQADVLLPVPLHRKRLFSRRYNPGGVARLACRPAVGARGFWWTGSNGSARHAASPPRRARIERTSLPAPSPSGAPARCCYAATGSC